MKKPILIYSDAPEGNTGLGRIARDLAQHIYEDLYNEFDVATYGYMSIGSKQFPWPQYTARTVDAVHPDLKRVWEDFSQGREGVLMPIMPPSWMFSLTHPEYAYQENPKIGPTCEWLSKKPFEIWSYLAIESCGPGMMFGSATKDTILQCTKPLFYSQFGQQVAENSGLAGLPYIHHGVYADKFVRSSDEAIARTRAELKCKDDTVVIGCVATNSSRKRLGTLFAAFEHYQQNYEKNSILWLHTNNDIADWNIPELCFDYGFADGESIAVSYTRPGRTDQWLCDMYSSCNVTVLPTYGEGFGYPIVESQFCGTPCISGSFACEQELATLVVGYVTSEPDGIHNLMRPHYNYKDYAHSIACAATGDYMHKQDLREHALAKWSWDVQWPKFREWLLK